MTTRALPVDEARALSGRVDLSGAGAWLLGFAVIGYLAVQGGGYDVVVRNQVGVALWWIVLVGAALGVLPRARIGGRAAAGLGLLTALGCFTALSATWSESSEGAISEASRISLLLALLLFALLSVRASHARALAAGVLTAIVSVAALACLSRLHPQWFADPETARFLPGARSRLAYPLNYWNALAGLVAIGLPLALGVAMGARTAVARALAVASLPLLVLTGFLTLSRGGLFAATVGLLAALVLTPQRGRWLGKLTLGAVGAAILVKGALQRDALRDGLQSALARHQGDELLVLVLVVTVGVALVHVGVSLAREGGLWPAAARPRRRIPYGGAITAGVVVAGVGIASAAGAFGSLDERWREFKNPQVGSRIGDNYSFARLGSASGNGRYQYWVSSVDAFETKPLAGLGAGSWESWWARNATLPGAVRNAHSLLAETLGELGVIGFALLVGLFILVIAAGVLSVRAATGPPAALLAGVTAACAAFIASASVDWVWQVTALPGAFVLLAAVLLAGRDRDRGGAETAAASPRPVVARAALSVLAVAGLIALVVPLAGVGELRSSQRAAIADRLDPALRHAETARSVQPYAGSPLLQRALVLELRGDLTAAAAAARRAESKEPKNWRAPFVLARLEARRDNVDAAVAAYRRARALNRASSFMRPQPR